MRLWFALMVACTGALVAALTGAVRRYALARSILDLPNERSSHLAPTPRGGGAAIACVLLPGLLLLAGSGFIAERTALALVGGGALVAAIGWLDDSRGVPAPIRALIHLVAAAWAVHWLGGLPSIDAGSRTVVLGGAGDILALLGIVWCTNLYNFMDGIDGIAGAQAVAAGVTGGLLLLAAGNPGLAMIALLAAAAGAGFLIWNWAPAKIFMGDVGSGLLGFLFGALAIASENRGAVPLLVWVIILGVFVFDATITLGRRMVRGERWYSAHCNHAYQRLARAGWSHASVTTAAMATAAVLGALAFAGWRWRLLLLPSVASASVMLAVLYHAVERIAPMGPVSLKRGSDRGTDAPARVPFSARRREASSPVDRARAASESVEP